MNNAILKAESVKMHFPVKGGVLKTVKGTVYAVDDVSFTINAGETLGIVGESGCGKTTLGRTLINLYRPSSGRVWFENAEISAMRQKDLLPLRRDFQMIFQDPYDSLNSRHTVRYILEEPFLIHRTGNRRSMGLEVRSLLDRVGLPSSALDRFPHEFSGGQRQRIGIARAIALKPKLIICDEPVSALDVSIQSQILNLLLDLQEDLGLTYLFISHDLTVVRHISDRIAVMYLGRIVETADADSIYSRPLHPYTKALISAIPQPDPSSRGKRIILKGTVPSPVNRPAGCFFHTRCPYASGICGEKYPELKKYNDERGEHLVSCHFAGEIPG